MANQRPLSITIICILGFIGVAISIPALFSPLLADIAPWYKAYMSLSILGGGAAMVGLWMMKKWSVYLYLALNIIGVIVMSYLGIFGIFSLIVPGIVIAIMFWKFNLMD